MTAPVPELRAEIAYARRMNRANAVADVDRLAAVLDAAEALAAAAREVVGYGMDARLDDAFDRWAKVTRGD